MVEYIYDFKEPPDPEGYKGRLIRCINCKFLLIDEFDNYSCEKWAGEETILDGFCHKGKRREE